MTNNDLKSGVQQIEELFGHGYAKAHPEIIAALLQYNRLHEVAHRLCQSLDSLAENVRSDHPLMGETFRGLQTALEEIASAIGAIAGEYQLNREELRKGNGDERR